MAQVDGVSVTSRVVVNGSRFGACYSNVTFSVNDYPAYFTSQIEDGLVVRGEEGLFVWQLTTVRPYSSMTFVTASAVEYPRPADGATSETLWSNRIL